MRPYYSYNRLLEHFEGLRQATADFIIEEPDLLPQARQQINNAAKHIIKHIEIIIEVTDGTTEV